jgi:hypothetical protein
VQSATPRLASPHLASPRLTAARELDERILEAHAHLRRAERDLAKLLAELAHQKHFLELGYASIHDYARTKLQLDTRKTRGLLRIGRALPGLPRLDQALASGELCWTKARELLAVVTAETEDEWIELARQSTSREQERTVAAHRPGEPPSHDGTKEAGPVRMSFTMEPVEAEQVRAALAALRAATGVSRDELGDGALLAQMAARAVHDVEGPDAPTGERFRIVIEHCPSCGHSAAPEAEISETHVGANSPVDCLRGEGRRGQRRSGLWPEPRPPRSRRLTHSRLSTETEAEILEMRQGPRRGHLSRTIPPATRRAVLQRDHHRCQVPGCSNRLWLDLHHLEYYRDGGDSSEGNLITLCSVHHQLLHDGLLGVERAEGGLVFRFGDGRELCVTHVGHLVGPSLITTVAEAPFNHADGRLLTGAAFLLDTQGSAGRHSR